MFTSEEWQRIGGALALSTREFEIVQLVFDDEKEASIARRLDISAHTVHTYMSRLYRKLRVRSRCELIVTVLAQYILLQSGDEA